MDLRLVIRIIIASVTTLLEFGTDDCVPGIPGATFVVMLGGAVVVCALLAGCEDRGNRPHRDDDAVRLV
jgi:hypothetical protein